MEPISWWRALRNGLHRMCPHCGRSPALQGWLTTRDRCASCGLVFERNPGDTWAFWVAADRLPLLVAIAVVYFAPGTRSWTYAATFVAALGVLIVGTIPHRLGLVVALHYLSRRYWPDPEDPIPATGPETPRVGG
jgi:uncharacterized protein (DUF983 family)